MAYVKEHPYQTGAVVLVGLLGLYLVLGSGGSSGGGSSGQSAAQLQLEEQQLAASSQAQQQQAQINGQVAAIAQQGANELALATIQAKSQGELSALQAQYESTHDILAYELGVTNIQGQVTQSQLAADVQNNSIATQGAVQLAGIEAEQNIAQINSYTSTTNTATITAGQVQQAQAVAQTQQQIATNQAQVAIAQTQANVSIAKAITSAQTTQGIGGIIGGIVKAVL